MRVNGFGSVFSERCVVESAVPNEIDMGAYASFMRAQGARRIEDSLRSDAHYTLRNSFVCDELDGELHPTLFGLMTFGRTPQRHPHTRNLFVRCVRYAGMDRAAGVISACEAKGRLDDQVGRAMGWLRSLRRREDLPLVPERPLREALLNAVIHRDYAYTASPVFLEVFADRVEVTSPGPLPNPITVEQATGGGGPRSRNEMMATAMVVRGLFDRRGAGWPTMRREMREFNGTEPKMVNDVKGERVRVTVWTGESR